MEGKKPRVTRIPGTVLILKGRMQTYLDGIIDQWLLIAPQANPAMLEMFRGCDYPPQRDLVPWAGEFAGKYLTAAVQVLRVTGDERLRVFITTFVEQLLSFQDPNGYLGPWPFEYRLTNYVPYLGEEGTMTWDTWGHYHIMLGLLLWYEQCGDPKVLQAVARIGDCICDTYLGSHKKRLVDTGMTEMNLAPAHSLCLLYNKTGMQRYLDMALEIVNEFSAQGPEGALAGDYLQQALSGKEFYQMPKPRWESLHPIMALAELYWITGDEKYRLAFEHIWWSIVKLDRHNTGGFSSGEQASGDPYNRGPIETCCTIAWIALSVEMLKLTGNSIVADEIELSILNSVLGMHSPTGRWATYNTPMDGVRRASTHSIVFQAREGSPELNCCSVNSPRGFGMLSEWALLVDEDGILVNYYGPSEMQTTTQSGCPVTLRQETHYPKTGIIHLQIEPDHDCVFTLKLRIPYWSVETTVSLNGKDLSGAIPGSYYSIQRMWTKNDVVELCLDMSLHFWAGESACEGLTSVYKGPILLTFDHRYNLHLSDGQPPSIGVIDEWNTQRYFLIDMPALEASTMQASELEWTNWTAPWVLYTFEARDGQTVNLCDFASAGATGTPYRSWLKVTNAPEPSPFHVRNPLRSRRVTKNSF